MEVGVVVFDGCDELDVIGPYEVLDNARRLGADVAVHLVSLVPKLEVTGDHGVRLRPHRPISDDLDVVIVPGGGWNDRKEAGLWGECQRGELPATLRRLHERGTTVASVCTGGMLLAAAGLAEGRPATTHHLALPELEEYGAEAVEERVVDDGDLITSGSSVGGIDLALWLVEREWGQELAGAIEDEMEYRRRGNVYASHQRGAGDVNRAEGDLE